MCAASLASQRDAGCTLSPRRAQHRGDAAAGPASRSQVGRARAQLAGDREVAPGVAEPDRRGEEQRPPPAARAAGTATPRRAGGPRRVDEVADQQVDRAPAPAAIGSVAAAGEGDQLAAGPLGERDAASRSGASVLVAVDDEHRAADRAGTSPRPRSRRLDADRRPSVDQRLRVGLQAPADAVLDLLGRVRLGERSREEELDAAAVVGAASSAGWPSPSPRRCRGPRRTLRRAAAHGQRRADRDHPGAPAPGARPPSAARADRPSTGPTTTARSTPSASSTATVSPTYSPVGVGGGVGGRSSGPLPRALDGDDPEVPGQVGHLRLPLPGVHDRPRR